MAQGQENGFELVKKKIVLSEYVGQFTKLTNRGSGHLRGRCPLHGGDNPSAFSIDDEKGLWKCFSGCGGGSVIDYWLAANDSTDMHEALEALASFSHVTLPEREGSENAGVSIARMRKALALVTEAAADLLYDTDDRLVRQVWKYMDERHITDDIADEWTLGFLPQDRREAVDFVIDAAGDKQALIEAGVLSKSKSGDSLYSPFAGRLLFPVRDLRGDPIAFGGRSIPGIDTFGDKYLNPHESRIYSKSKVMYGMHRLKNAERVIVGEGYLDAIAVAAANAPGVVGVAACGTSLTTGQVEILSKYAEVVFMSDGDAAGQKAISSAYWSANTLGDRAKAHLLTDDKDPWDTYLDGPKAFRKLLKGEFPSLLTAGVEAKRETEENDRDFDQWVSAAVASLSRSDHSDLVLRTAARLRKQAVRDYARSLGDAKVKRKVDPVGPQVALDPNMRSLVSRILQFSDDEHDACFASLSDWDDSVESAIRSWLPVSSETDLEVFTALVASPVFASHSPEVDRALAECMPEDKDQPEDISLVIRNLCEVLRADAQSLLAQADAPATLVAQIVTLREIERIKYDPTLQTSALAFLIDLVVDMARWRAYVDD